jgi:TPR repeat protein
MMGSCGVEADAVEAARWYKLGAEHRHVPSMLTLSSLYYRGTDIARDEAAALAWAGLAATNAPSADFRERAMKQLREFGEAATKDTFGRAQSIADEALQRIDENVALYKRGGS